MYNSKNQKYLTIKLLILDKFNHLITGFKGGFEFFLKIKMDYFKMLIDNSF